MKKDTLPEEVMAENGGESGFETETNDRPVDELADESQSQVEDKLIEELTLEEQLVAMEAKASEYEAKAAEYLDGWQRARKDFIQKLEDRDPETEKEGWQKHYFRGLNPDGSPGSGEHQTRIRPKPFVKS